MHHLSCGISSLLRSVKLFLFTLLLTNVMLRISPHQSPPLLQRRRNRWGKRGRSPPAMLKPRGRECRFSLVIIGLCHICQLVASQTPIRLSSFKIIVYFKTGATRCQILRRNAPNSISSVPLGSLQHSQGPLAIFNGSLIKGGSREGGKKKARERGSGEKREGRIASSNREVWIRHCTVMPFSTCGSLDQSPTSRPDKDFGLPPRTICEFLLSNCLLLNVVLSLSLALVFGTLFLPTSLQHLFCSLSENV